MKDHVVIQRTDVNHFEITRVMQDKVNRANLENDLKELQMRREGIVDQLYLLEENIKNYEQALELKKDGDSTEGISKVLEMRKLKKG